MQTLIYTVTIFISAALLFLVQPMYAKMMLPLLGGVPAVWNTAMVFFQAALLLGYSYSHWITNLRSAKSQLFIHLAVCMLPLLMLPIAVPANANPPAGDSPVAWLLLTMAITVGLPFFVVSSTSPLLQRWFSYSKSSRSNDPYFLYAASNLGSMIALFGYPLYFERAFAVGTQAQIWSWGYIVAVLLIAASGSFVWKHTRAEEVMPDDAQCERISASRAFRWLLLAFVPSSLMMSVTSYITTDLVSAPMLWVIPLGIYLLTFSFVFAKRRVIPQGFWRVLAPLFILGLLIVLSDLLYKPVMWMMVGHLVALFVIAMFCHGELAQDRPTPRRLTNFFLIIALGGVLGGAFNALLAPIAFNGIFEYPLILILAGFLLPARPNQNTVQKYGWDYAIAAMGALAMYLIFRYMPDSGKLIIARWNFRQLDLKELLFFAVPAVLCLVSLSRPVRFGMLLGTIFLLSFIFWRKDPDLLMRSRSFFGVLKVRYDSDLNANTLLHGTTLHGVQQLDARYRGLPSSYYDRTGPLGDIFRLYPNIEHADIAVVGLGTGTVAAYGQPGQSITYFEIDRRVLEVARDSGYFTYLTSCAAKLDFVMGDARLRMRDDPRRFDLILLDAYSSDAVPMHLITAQAMEIYKSHLKPGGWISFHISNRYFRFGPEVALLAESVGMNCLIRSDSDPAAPGSTPGKFVSVWTLCLSPDDPMADALYMCDWHPPDKDPNVTLWTDDFNSILQVFTGFKQ